VQFEKKPYHVECFKCQEEGCSKKMEGASKAAIYEDKLMCQQCFAKGGYAQKQKKVVWTKREGGDDSGAASKFGGGGAKCTVCDKTVYAAEAVSFEKKPYHADCMKCTTCSKICKLSDVAQFEEEDKSNLYCLKCFETGGFRQKQAKTTKTHGASNPLASKFGGGGNKCIRCDKTVYPAETIQFEKKFFHPDCFTCEGKTEAGTCGVKLNSGNAKYLFDENKNLQVYCKKCWDTGGLGRAKENTTWAGPAAAAPADTPAEPEPAAEAE
jgi:cysteine/glycine-rich protein